MVKLIASSVVRGSQSGESHGGIFIIDVVQQAVRQCVDWNAVDIEWRGHGGDRGLRGIAFDGDRIYVAATDRLLAYSADFQLLDSWCNPYLKNCHEIAVYERSLFIASTGFDSVLAFDLDNHCFDWAMHILFDRGQYRAARYDPNSDDGPIMLDKLRINNVHCAEQGMYIGTANAAGMLHFNGKAINVSAELPKGTNNAQPFRDGVLFNDTQDDVLRYTGRGEGEEDRAMAVPKYDSQQLERANPDDGDVARQGFARGLCVVTDRVVAGGSSPATVTLYDLAANETLVSAALTMDVRNTIHGLEVWPYD